MLETMLFFLPMFKHLPLKSLAFKLVANSSLLAFLVTNINTLPSVCVQKDNNYFGYHSTKQSQSSIFQNISE